MTLIIGVDDGKRIVIGSDGLASNGKYKYNVGSKLIKVKNFIVGYTLSFRFAQIIKFNKSEFENIKSEKDVWNFVQTLKKVMIREGSKKESADSKDLEHPVTFLLATEVGLFTVCSNYQFHKLKRWAVGSGDMYGLGYFDASDENNLEKRIRQSIVKTSTIIPSVG